MKKLLALVLAFLMISLVLFSGCTEYVSAKLVVKIISDPVGGQNVNRLKCVYTVQYVPGMEYKDGKWGGSDKYSAPQRISLSIYWTNEKGGRYNEQEKIFGQDPLNPGNGTFESTFDCPTAGAYFDKTFWLVFDWIDNGMSTQRHTVPSASAICWTK